MILVHLTGGLGNQLFQYAAACSLAHLHGTEVVLDLSFYGHTRRGVTPRTFELDNYPITARLANSRETYWARLSTGKISKIFPVPGPWRVYKENEGVFNDRMLSLPDNSLLDGYWQSERYFSAIPQIIRSQFRYNAAMTSGEENVASIMRNANSVFIHVRRGDYVNNPSTNAMHCVCSLLYYLEAIDTISRRIPDPVFFVFSDDMEWATANLDIKYPCHFMDSGPKNNACGDLRLMSLCKHGIIANSSFSWWGAWLIDNSAKVIIAPKKWFNTSESDYITPDSWIRL